MIPTTIHDLAAPRPVAHGEVMPQEIRVGQMLLAQSVIALTKRIDTLLAAQEAAAEPLPPTSGIGILKRAIERAERPAKGPKPANEPAARRGSLRPGETPAAQIPSGDGNPGAANRKGNGPGLTPCAPAPVVPPAPVEVRSNGVPVDLALRYHEAYLEGREARRGGQAVDLNPFTGDRGIAGGRRLAWVRGWNEGAGS